MLKCGLGVENLAKQKRYIKLKVFKKIVKKTDKLTRANVLSKNSGTPS